MRSFKPLTLTLTAALMGLNLTVHAGIITVNEANDDFNSNGNCSLREALSAANNNTAVDGCNAGDASGGDLILVLPASSGNAILIDSTLTVSDEVTLLGPGIDQLVLIADSSQNDFPLFRLDMGNNSEDFSLNNLTVGGAKLGVIEVVVADRINIASVKFSGNHRSDAQPGGVIHAVTNNPNIGGATQLINEINITDSEFVQNSAIRGGAIGVIIAVDLNIENTLFRQNQASELGGAIHVADTNASLFVSQSEFDGNQALNVGYFGGAIDSGAVSQWISQSLFRNNSATSGAAVHLHGTSLHTTMSATLINNTFNGNTASDFNNATLSMRSINNANVFLSHNTLAENTGRSVSVEGSNIDVYLRANLFADALSNNCELLQGDWISLGDNVDAGGTSCLGHANDISDPTQTVLPLADYGGPTLTQPPHPSSSAVDAGDTTCLTANGGFTVNVDQRDEPRPRDGNASGGLGQCDAGAFEWPNAESLVIAFSGTGDGTVHLDAYDMHCESTSGCLWPLPENQTVTLNPTPAPGSEFTGWSGACSGSGSCQVPMSGFTAVNAAFEIDTTEYILNITKFIDAPGQKAAVTSQPGGIDCGASCSASFVNNTAVQLTAAPEPGTKVDIWQGCDAISPDGLQCTVNLNADTTVNLFLTEDEDLIFYSDFD